MATPSQFVLHDLKESHKGAYGFGKIITLTPSMRGSGRRHEVPSVR